MEEDNEKKQDSTKEVPSAPERKDNEDILHRPWRLWSGLMQTNSNNFSATRGPIEIHQRKAQPERPKGFAAVAGMEELKKQLRRDFIDVVRNRELAAQYAIIPPGMLFFGPPGTGKTYIAKHLAEELDIEFKVIYPSDLGNIYIHGSQMLIRQLFEKAKEDAEKNGKGVLLVFDEIDSMAPVRTADDQGHQGGEVAEFLAQLNDAAQRSIYVIGTTNCIDRLDKAVVRKGRLDKVVYIGLPDEDARAKLFEYELKQRVHDENIDCQKLASLTDGYTASDVAYIVAECARIKFGESLQNVPPEPVAIDQSIMEQVIADTRSSVTRADARRYLELRDEYAQGAPVRPRVGFK